MQLSELELNRQLYKTQPQTVETLDADEVASSLTPPPSTALASGNSVYDVNTNGEMINGDVIEPGTLPPTVLDIANWGWTQTCAFAPVDVDQVNWGAGTFTSADGTNIYAISAGNSGTMGVFPQRTYIYLDINVSTTTYQRSTTATDAIGVGKVLIAVCSTAQGGGGLQATYVLVQATQIVGDNVLANTINANRIVAGSITATQLSATIVYAGSIVIDTNGLIRGGQTAYDTGSGFFLGYSGGGYKLSVGNASGSKMTWDGTSLDIVGSLSSSTGNQKVIISGTSALYYNASGTLIAHTLASSNSFLIGGETAASNIIFDSGSSGVVAFSNNGNLTVIATATALNPFVDDAMDLGDPTFAWKDLHLAGEFNYQEVVQPIVYFGYMEYVSETIINGNANAWTVAKLGTGRYEITHNLGNDEYVVVATASASAVKYITIENRTADDFIVRMADVTPTLEDNNFYFTLMILPS